ncbi:MAG: nuclear transport factor 2 family protein [Thermoplasmata archaeon]
MDRVGRRSPPSGVRTRGKAAFVQNFGDDELGAHVTRMTEEKNVVVVESEVRVQKKDGRHFAVQSCNIFEVENDQIKRLTSFADLVKDSA